MIYLITHGDRGKGPDPGHTPEGLAQIERLSLPEGIQFIVTGTGRRFLEMLRIVQSKLPGVPVRYSPFCGGPEGWEGENKIIFPDGTIVDYSDYIGVSNSPLDMWDFVKALPGRTILCAGGALMSGLGLKEISEKGRLYELDPANRTGRLIV